MPTADRRQRPPLPGPIGPLMEPVYTAVIARRNRAFDAGRRVTRLPIPVISVGNLSVGGTGKTPTVMHLVQLLRDAGHRPAVAMRGYKARPGEASDEQREYLDRFPDLTVIAHPDRARAVTAALSRDPGGFDVVILDDAFQHRFVARDLDLVLIDAARDPFADRCLPAGWLREPVTALARAHAVLITHAQAVSPETLDALRRRLAQVNPSLLIATSRHDWDGLQTAGGIQPVTFLAGKNVAALCGIGNPAPFLHALRAAGATITDALIMPDHHRWSPADRPLIAKAAGGASAGADLIVTTAKDWTKLRPFLEASPPAPVVVPRVAIRLIDHAQDLRDRVLAAAAPRPATL